MNAAAALLTSPPAGAQSAVPASSADAPAEEGFASALASSIAGMAKQGQSAPQDQVTESLQTADATQDPTLADVMQWLCLPGATPAVQAEPSAGEAATTEQSPVGSHEQALSAANTTASRSPAPCGAAGPGELLEGDAAVLAGAPVTDAGTSAEGATTLPQTSGASPVQTPQAQLAALAPAPMRDVGTATSSVSGGTSVHASLREHVGTARWADELGSRMVLMSVRGQQEGSLTLMPEHLGPLEVQISVNKDTANVWFGAQHADTRAALSEALPRLRELFAASGLSLGQAGVSEQAPRRESPGPEGAQGIGATDEGSSGIEAAAPAWRPLRTGLIDTYA